jgi:hypothetical protein
MMIHGTWFENITCPKCRYRHPALITCSYAAELAAAERAKAQDVYEAAAKRLNDALAVQAAERPLWHQIVDKLSAATEEDRAIMTDLLWKFTRGDWHGVADAACDMREQVVRAEK